VSPLQAKWDAIYRQSFSQNQACEVLRQHIHLLPAEGKALDLACGLGSNALLLAANNLSVDALDISAVALERLKASAQEKKRAITTHLCDLSAVSLPQGCYDVIVISRFLDRTLCNAIMAALRPEGLLFYQTFTRNKLDQQGPSNPDYLLDCNELLQLFSSLTLVCYQEYAHAGDLRHGNRNEACYIGQKRIPVPI